MVPFVAGGPPEKENGPPGQGDMDHCVALPERQRDIIEKGHNYNPRSKLPVVKVPMNALGAAPHVNVAKAVVFRCGEGWV